MPKRQNGRLLLPRCASQTAPTANVAGVDDHISVSRADHNDEVAGYG